jgi:hypothetical protein
VNENSNPSIVPAYEWRFRQESHAQFFFLNLNLDPPMTLQKYRYNFRLFSTLPMRGNAGQIIAGSSCALFLADSPQLAEEKEGCQTNV